MKSTLLLSCAALLIATCPAIAQNRVEIGPDGRDTAVFDMTSMNANASFAMDSVPYALTPDWSLNLRMQVGGLHIGDLDHDQDPDLAVACYRSQSFPPYLDWRNFVLYNQAGQLQGVPGWWSADSIASTEVRIADFNNDNHPDLYSGNGESSFPPDAIYFGMAGDSISRTRGWTASNSTWTTGAAVCDFDHDGDIDVATSNQGIAPIATRPVQIFRNNNGVLESVPFWSSSASEISSGITWADVNNDGYEELAVSKWVSYRSGIYRNDSGVVQTSPFWTANTTQGQKGIAFADVNGDSLLDVAISGSVPTQVYLNTGGNFGSTPDWESQNTSHSSQDIAWADIDGDGDPDLATAEFTGGVFRIYLNRSGQLDHTPSWQYDSPNVGTALSFGDINGDGRIDLIVGMSGQPCVSVFYNRLTTAVREQTTPAEFTLRQNYPNPFNPSTTISFSLPQRAHATLSIYNLLGQEIATLVSEDLAPGTYSAEWKASSVAGGMYIYRLQAGNFTASRKLLLVK